MRLTPVLVDAATTAPAPPRLPPAIRPPPGAQTLMVTHVQVLRRRRVPCRILHLRSSLVAVRVCLRPGHNPELCSSAGACRLAFTCAAGAHALKVGPPAMPECRCDGQMGALDTATPSRPQPDQKCILSCPLKCRLSFPLRVCILVF